MMIVRVRADVWRCVEGLRLDNDAGLYHCGFNTANYRLYGWRTMYCVDGEVR